MDGRRHLHSGPLTLALHLGLVLLLGPHLCSANNPAKKNQCDKPTVVTTKICQLCYLAAKPLCPEGYHLKGAKGRSCWHHKTFSFGCEYECYKEVTEVRCCPGYWGSNCQECPETAERPCNNNGVCSDGMSGNGTCTCQPGFMGTACENCEENKYGPTCTSVCSCVHGICNQGIKGDGTCTCFSGYKGPNCDQELPACSALRCPQNARCFEDAHTSMLACKCLPGYQSGGTQCSSINPCLRNVCHTHAICTHLGPNQHSCSCVDGYQGDGYVCMPVDPCQTNLGGCPENSTHCVYDSPGKSHCQCLDGFEHLVPGVGCSLRDICQPTSCDKNAVCATIKPGVVQCTCRQGFQGSGKVCYGDIMHQLRELNTNVRGAWYNQLSSAITLFDSSMSWPLSSLGPFTVFVPINKAFKGTSVKTLVADKAGARYRTKLHMVAGELSHDVLKKGYMFYTLTGKSAESTAADEDQYVKFRIYGSRKRADILKPDIVASNGVIHLISKLMDSVAPTVQSQKDENLMKILTDNGKFSKFRNLFEHSNMAHILDGSGPYTFFAPTDVALNAMKEGYLDFLLSDQGKLKLQELLKNHIISPVLMEAVNIASTPLAMSMANQALTFNITQNGQILVNGEAVLEADVEAKNGLLYSLDGVLIPPSIEPVLPHRCDVKTSTITKSPCVSCSQMNNSTCPSGEPMLGSQMKGCIFRHKMFQMKVAVMGCTFSCNNTVMTPVCCKGFYGPDCSACPGGFLTPCSGHGTCLDGIDGNGTCLCDENFKGSRCQYCSRQDKYGPNCDKTCTCIHGRCDNRPEADGSCKVDTCQYGYTGSFCERQTRPCGPKVDFCHAFASCDFNGGAVRCVCKPGYQGDGITCVEEDPCALPRRGGCSKNSKCVKRGPGTHICQCLMGWKEDGDECQPINRCLEPNRGGCHPNATCIYVGPGQNDCECRSGFHGNGEECEASNECVDQNGGCHYLATCRYLSSGSWKCVCEEGYAGDGKICYGTMVQELSALPQASDFRKWVADAGLDRNLSETQNLTLFIPSTSAVQGMRKEDQDFWVKKNNLANIVKYHMVHGVYQLMDLQDQSQLSSFLTGTLLVSRTNETKVGGATVVSSDIAAINGLMHVIDSVLVPDQKLSRSLVDLLGQRPQFSLFRQYLIQYNLTEDLEKFSAYTVLAPTNDAINEFLKKTGSESLDSNSTKYHIVPSEKLTEKNVRDGTYWQTMLGFSYQVGVFLRNGRMFINDVPVNLTSMESTTGVVHALTSVLQVVKNRCDQEQTSLYVGPCQSCWKKLSCPSNMRAERRRSGRCLYRHAGFSRRTATFSGCQMVCLNTTVTRKCCADFFGDQCERCPGPVGQPCFGNGVCLDGTRGNGTCQCKKGFDGTACETCVSGKYGSHCDQDCQCIHGRCHSGPQGSGMCDCDVGWRGVACDTAITEDSCNRKCHTSANCVVQSGGSSICRCAAGFEGNGTHCSAVDACKSNNGGCDEHATCKRTSPGQRQCLCHLGFTGDGVVCVEINPCLVGNGGCHANSECVHTGPNKTACICVGGYSGDGKTSCTPINPCETNKGGCHRFATCQMTGPGQRNCSCTSRFVGDGIICKGSVFSEILRNGDLADFFKIVPYSALSGPGPFTVFAPNAEAFKKEVKMNEWSQRQLIPWIAKQHIVVCHALSPEDLRTPKNVTTLTGEVLTITYSQGTIYINEKVKVVSSDDMSFNGIIHVIDTILVPNTLRTVPQSYPQSKLSDVASLFGHTTFTKLLEDTEVQKFLDDVVHQPVTVFLPTDQALAALPQEQKDFLYNAQNRDQLTRYLSYHVIRDAKLRVTDFMEPFRQKTLLESDIRVTCGGENSIGELFLNDGKCRIVHGDLTFKGGVAHGIDCLLTPLSLGGRCDSLEAGEVTSVCTFCSRNFNRLCPAATKFRKTQLCQHSFLRRGCQAVCAMVHWKPKCCAGYFGRDCMACPGGAESPCGGHGKCDEGHLGNGTCACKPGFQGDACELCLQGHYGPSCQVCSCTAQGSCDDGILGTGSCFCNQGWTGSRCESRLAVDPVCSPVCSSNAVCRENNTCVCSPFYGGDGITCTVADLCSQQNGGCARDAKCKQTGVKVTCACPRWYHGDGYVCSPINLCAADDSGGCHEHATCTMTGPGKRKCECKNAYIGDGIACEERELPVNRCALDNEQCHVDAECTDLHYEDKTVGVFSLRSPEGQYKLTYAEAQDVCMKNGATIATFNQLSYAQEAGFGHCSAGWLDNARVAYPTTYPNPKCGFGHVGIVDYGTRVNKSETWDVFCYRMKDISCACKPGYVGNGYDCSGNLMQVLAATPTFSNFLTQILNYSSNSKSGTEFVMHLSNLTVQNTLFVPDNSGLDNQTLSAQDIEYHLSEGSAVYFQDLTNGSQIRTRLGHSLQVLGIANFTNPSILSNTRYINDRFIIDWDIPASNGIIHVIQGPLRAPPPKPELHTGHRAGIGIGVLLVMVLMGAAAFVGYRFYTLQTKPFEFHYFKEDDVDDAASVTPHHSINNPMYESASCHSAPGDPVPPEDDVDDAASVTPHHSVNNSLYESASCYPTRGDQIPSEEDKHQVVDGGHYNLLQDS